MDTLSRLIMSLSRGLLMRALFRAAPGRGAAGVVVVLLALVAFFVSASAHAQSCPEGQTYTETLVCWDQYGVNPAPGCHSTPQAYCDAVVHSDAPVRTILGTGSPVSCKGESAGGFDRFQIALHRSAIGSCSAPPDDPNTLCKAGNVITGSDGGPGVYGIPRLTTFVCDGTCAARAKAAGEFGGKNWAWGPLILTGGPCVPGDPTVVGNPDPPTADPLKPGYCPGTVNGVAVQVPCKSTTTGKETKTESAASPASGASASGTGKTTERTETKCEAGVCTSTTTIVNNYPDGTSDTKKKEEQKDEKSFCEENPSLAICKEGRFGGTCGGAFTCDGDAIQCAMAREQHVRNCQFFGQSAASDLGLSAAAGGDRPSGHPGLSPTGTTFDGFDQSPLIGGGACPADLSVPMGSFPPLTVSFTALCGVAGWLGNLLVSLTALACISIVFVRGSS